MALRPVLYLYAQVVDSRAAGRWRESGAGQASMACASASASFCGHRLANNRQRRLLRLVVACVNLAPWNGELKSSLDEVRSAMLYTAVIFRRSSSR
jgi:hypothetical protein